MMRKSPFRLSSILTPSSMRSNKCSSGNRHHSRKHHQRDGRIHGRKSALLAVLEYAFGCRITPPHHRNERTSVEGDAKKREELERLIEQHFKGRHELLRTHFTEMREAIHSNHPDRIVQ